MISISDALEDIIRESPFIEEGLSRGIINFSAYAREIKPIIEKRLFKDIKNGAIVMALKRISDRLSKNQAKNTPPSLTDITVRSNLTELTFQNSENLADKQRSLFNQLGSQKAIFCTVSQGVRETTFVADQEATEAIEKIFIGENKVVRIDNLASITIHLPKEVVYTIGSYYQILKKLAWENINIIEALSTYTEITIVFESPDIDRAFSVLKRV